MKERKLYIFLFATLLAGCEKDEQNLFSKKTWECPSWSYTTTWVDWNKKNKTKLKAIGCKNIFGSRVDFHIAWRDNSVKDHEGAFINDKANGEWSYYNKTGSLFTKGTMVNDKLSGEWTYYHNNGSIYSRGHMVNDKYQGKWVWWDKNGKFISEAIYDNGIKVK